MIKVALIGQPNSGKTTIFNILTGARAHVGNWPGVTVEKRQGLYRKDRTQEPISIIDLPGIYSLSPYTPEEIITRDYLLSHDSDIIVNVVDATAIERSLFLTTQLLETNIPIVIALNMNDELRNQGKAIDADLLSKRLNVPVVPLCALEEEGIDDLINEIRKTAKIVRTGYTVLENTEINDLISETTEVFREKEVVEPLFHAIKVLENDEYENKRHEDSAKKFTEIRSKFTSSAFNDDLEAYIADARYKYIVNILEGTISDAPTCKKTKLNKTQKLDKVFTNKYFGIPIFLLIIFLVFHLTFSQNFLFLSLFIPKSFVSLEGTAFAGVFGKGAINSPGVILFNLLDLGASSLITWLKSIFTGPEWLSGLLFDGVLSGIFAVLTFLPQILLLFLFISILEDTGYMARVAFLFDRIFNKFGLSGRSIIPMIMGFGCSVPAIINTRTLKSEFERVTTIRVIPFFSCGAKLPLLTAIAGGIVQYFGVASVDLIVFLMYVTGIALAIITSIIMRKTLLRGRSTPFIMELPPYRRPKFSALMIHLFDKAKHFIKKAFTIILISTVVIWIVSHFDFYWGYLSDEHVDQSILANIARLITPLFTPLGFGNQLGNYGWIFVVGAISGLVAKENIISTFGTVAATLAAAGIVTATSNSGADNVTAMIEATGIGIPGLLAFIVFNMTTIPCAATVSTAKAELTPKQFRSTLLFWFITSYIIGTIVYLVFSYWWTVFIFIALFIILMTLIYFISKNKDFKEAQNG
jgi:ferrous iron transport protein B